MLEEATLLAEQITAGVDQNANGQIEPFEGECGLRDIMRFGLLAGSLELREGTLMLDDGAGAS